MNHLNMALKSRAQISTHSTGGAGMYIGHDVVGGSKRATVVRSARDGVRVTKECRLLPPVGR